MIDVIGTRRLLILLAMVAINAAFGAGLYYYMRPQEVSLENELSSVKTAISSKEGDIANLQVELDKLIEQRDTFKHLKKMGFFSTQDRIDARERIDEIRELSRVLSVKYLIKPAVLESNENIERANHVILSSSFHVDIDALDDMDIYRFMYLLKTSFPGHVSFDKIELVKLTDVNEPVLKKIGSGEPVVVVRARIDFTWRTILPEDEAKFGDKSVAQKGM